MSKNPKKSQKTSRFGSSTEKKIDYILEKRSKPNTNRATKLWLSCFTDYLAEKKLPKEDEIADDALPEILLQFYSEVRKKEIKENPGQDISDDDKLYKNTTLKAIRGALARHFKNTRSIDIISNERFIKANAVFEGVTKINKEKGKGNIVSKPPIEDVDLLKLTEFFKQGMAGPPNATLLQEIVLFYILMYMCRRGRENLRPMTVDTFKVATDAEDNRQYIYQAIDEADKNHGAQDTSKSNDGRIYEVPSKYPD